MKKAIFSALLAALVCGGYAIAQPMTQASVASLPPAINSAASRACLFPVGGWTIVNCSNAAAATSAQLNAFGRYVIQCGDDSYIATGDEATDVADANDGWLPTGAWLEFLTTDSVRYISCLNKTIDSDCRLWECK